MDKGEDWGEIYIENKCTKSLYPDALWSPINRLRALRILAHLHVVDDSK